MYKKDLNHDEIEGLFNQFGWITVDTSWSKGKLLDFIAYKIYGDFWFVEVKNGNKPLTKDEIKFFHKHSERSVLIRSTDEAIKFLKSHIATRAK